MWTFFQDKNGTIEDEELQGFLKDLLELAQEVTFYQFPPKLKYCNFPVLFSVFFCKE